MKAPIPPRSARRAKGRRARKREASAYFLQVLKLRSEGRSVSAIASTTRTSPDLVRDVLEFAERARKEKGTGDA